jgi:hypothetical protein
VEELLQTRSPVIVEEDQMLNKVKKLAIALIVPVALAGGLGASTLTASAGTDKVTICHLASSKYVKITVSESAVPAHLKHGDVLADAYGDCP